MSTNLCAIPFDVNLEDRRVFRKTLRQTFLDTSTALPSNMELERFCRKFDSFELRRQYVDFSWPILSAEFLLEVAEFVKDSTVLEVAAGNGFLSHWLTKYGVNVIATSDDLSWGATKLDPLPIVQKEDALEALAKYNADIVVLSWPYMDVLAANVWHSMKTGQKLLYIGESRHGCTANEEFFDLTENAPSHEFNELIRWQGIHDYATLLTK